MAHASVCLGRTSRPVLRSSTAEGGRDVPTFWLASSLAPPILERRDRDIAPYLESRRRRTPPSERLARTLAPPVSIKLTQSLAEKLSCQARRSVFIFRHGS